MIPQIQPHEVKNRLDSGLPTLLLDVREPDEYAICRLPGSVLVPLGDLPGQAESLEIPDGTMVVVYCHHGVRSLRGAGVLMQAGIGNVASMAGGIEWWSQLIDPGVPRY